jgi:hypothetical protein
MAGSCDHPEHWRQRAGEMRAHAREMRDLAARASMLDIADQYDRLALRAEERLRRLKTAA